MKRSPPLAPNRACASFTSPKRRRVHFPRRDALETLAQDFYRLPHFLHPHIVTVETVAQGPGLAGTDRHFEIKLRIYRIRNVTADVPLDSGTAEIRPDEVVGHRLFFADDRDTGEPRA